MTTPIYQQIIDNIQTTFTNITTWTSPEEREQKEKLKREQKQRHEKRLKIARDTVKKRKKVESKEVVELIKEVQNEVNLDMIYKIDKKMRIFPKTPLHEPRKAKKEAQKLINPSENQK